MYRILAADQPVRERRNQREHPHYTKPELVATAPNQTWSWDITKLLGPTKWTYFYLYVVLDIFSRYAVGWMVADRENSALAGRLIEETCHKQGVQPQVLTLHSDRGAPMTSKCTAQLLADLGVTRSLSRPQVSDDNPFSEAQFKTLKYHPGFPGRATSPPPPSLTEIPKPAGRLSDASTTSPPRSPSAERSSLGTTPNIAMAGSRCSPRTTCITIEPDERAGAARADPSSRLDPSSRTLRSRNPTTGSPSPSRLDQPTCDTHNRRNCSVNRNRHCLKVVDRFRTSRIGLLPPLKTSAGPPLPTAQKQTGYPAAFGGCIHYTRQYTMVFDCAGHQDHLYTSVVQQAVHFPGACGEPPRRRTRGAKQLRDRRHFDRVDYGRASYRDRRRRRGVPPQPNRFDGKQHVRGNQHSRPQ